MPTSLRVSRRRWITLGAVAALAAGCGRSTAEPTPPEPVPLDGASYWPAETWRSAEPAAVGFDRTLMADLVRRLRAGEAPFLHSFLVIRQGYVVVEEYRSGWTREQAHSVQSVTKSVTSLLTGIAIDAGALPGPDARVLDLLPGYADVRNDDARKRSLRVADLLTMRTGLAWREDPYAGSPLMQLNTLDGDWVRFVLDWPMGEEPGTRFEYNSGGVIVLGGILRGRRGESVEKFARSALFAPIGATGEWWYVNRFDGLAHTGGGLNLRPVDMARLGYLVLRRGRWNDAQVVPEAWLASSLSAQSSPSWSPGGLPSQYGFLWWLLPFGTVASPSSTPNELIYTAAGAGGQWIFVVPKLDLVVVSTSDVGLGDPSAAVRYLYDFVLRAAH